MSWFRSHGRAKIRFNDDNPDSSPIAAEISGDGRIRLETDPDANTLRAAYMTTAQVREFALELLGLCDVADALELAEPAL